MIEITGKYNTAKVFTDNLDDTSRKQIENLCNQEFVKGSKIRLMPDVHAGMGCTIGTTMTIGDKIVPNLVGVDIGCGMETVVLSKELACVKGFQPSRLDDIIYKNIPCGMDTRKTEHEFVDKIDYSKIRWKGFNLQRARKSIGTLGGGNHFVEACNDDEGNLYIVIHSGSRHLGNQVAQYYQDEAWKQVKNEGVVLQKDLAYASGKLYDDYMNDMKITQQYAFINRKAMMSVIMKELGIATNDISEQFTTIHNYIDTDTMILRKGAVSANKGEKLLIPINMRDGSLICEGLGNEDWNNSAPHGAGRLMSRTKAFASLKMDDFKDSMKGIYTTSVNKKTLDEAPMCYKNADEIIKNITPTAKILKTIKPIYNFKAAE